MMKVYKFVCPFHGLQQGQPIKIEIDVAVKDTKLDQTIKTKKEVDGVKCPSCKVQRQLNECEIIEEKNE